MAAWLLRKGKQQPRRLRPPLSHTVRRLGYRAGGDMRGNPFADARIETARLVLRPFERREVDAFCEIAGQEEVLKFLPSTDRMTSVTSSSTKVSPATARRGLRARAAEGQASRMTARRLT